MPKSFGVPETGTGAFFIRFFICFPLLDVILRLSYNKMKYANKAFNKEKGRKVTYD